MAENAPFYTENFKNFLRPRTMRAAGTIFYTQHRSPHFSDESYTPLVVV